MLRRDLLARAPGIAQELADVKVAAPRLDDLDHLVDVVCPAVVRRMVDSFLM